MVLTLKDVTKSFSDKVILDNINITIEDRDRIGLIGVNGAGKTTLLNIISKELNIDSGDIFIEKKSSIGYLKQNTGLNSNDNIYEAMLHVFDELKQVEEKMHELEEAIVKIDDHNSQQYHDISQEYASLSAFFEVREGYNIDVKIKTILNGMGFSDKAYSTVVKTLSGGEKTRLALAKLLLEEPTLLILDEPTNHLDFKTLMWLEEYLTTYKGALLVVSHDRYFLDRMVEKIWEVEFSKVQIYKGNYTKYKVLKEERYLRLLKEYEQQQNTLASMQEYVDKNLVRASTSNSAKSRIHQMENMEILEKPQLLYKTPHFQFDFTKDPVKDILKVYDMTLKVGKEKKVLCENINLEVKRGEKIALIGRNGIGKSTLLKAILGENTESDGDVIWGRNVTKSYYEQENQNLNFENTVLEELWGRFPNMMEFKVRGVLGQMLITDDNVYKPIKVISGGERARLGFAIMVTEHSNTLIFDEPTNHLDLASKEALEKALRDFKGTLIFVSHDRYFLNTIPTKIIEMVDNGVNVYDGNFDYYLERSKLVAQKAKQEEVEQKPKKENQTYYRSKQQRSEDAKRRTRISKLEKLMEEAELQIAELDQLIASGEIASNYEKLAETCELLEKLKQDNDNYMEEWLILTEE